MRYGMVIDLSQCTGCGACATACKQENGTPPGVFWSTVRQYETGKYPKSKLKFLPTLCMHCEEPACVEACPTHATQKRADGIVVVDDEVCIGCGYCVWACPYEARSLNHADPQPYYPAFGFTPFEEIVYKDHQKGIIEKCTFCAHRVDRGEQPACVLTCPTSARVFGDLDDPGSEISRLLAERGGQQRFKELDTDPHVYYLNLDLDLER